jgi:hypothetical protein
MAANVRSMFSISTNPRRRAHAASRVQQVFWPLHDADRCIEAAFI